MRTPFGRLGGGLARYPATELGAIAIRAALERAGIEPQEPDYVIMGQVLQGGAGQAPARQAAVGAGPADRDARRHDQQGLRLVDPRGRDRRLDDPRRRRRARRHRRHGVDVERARTSSRKARFGYRLGDGTLIDLMTHDGLVSSFDGKHMVEQASFVSRELGISREEQDAWAFRSHQRAVAAIDAGRFARRDRPGRRGRGRREPRGATPRSRSSRR